MDEFLRYVVQQLVEYPDEVLISQRQEGDKITYLLSMRQTDVGRLIGKGGSTIQAIRELLRASAEKDGRKVAVEIAE
ncbi:MAG: KH domain-containing protein [Verrucomicrobia bacterium]|nr:KH domain-containing protein [Verrucomicrobiota bacterium]